MTKSKLIENSSIAGVGLIVAWFIYSYIYYNNDYKKFAQKHCQDSDKDGRFDNPYTPFGITQPVKNTDAKISPENFNISQLGLSTEIGRKVSANFMNLNLTGLEIANCKISYRLYKFGGKQNIKSKIIMKLI